MCNTDDMIISALLGDIKAAYKKNSDLESLFDNFFRSALDKTLEHWRIVSQAALFGIPTPVFSIALAFYDGYRTIRLPANLLPAQRDYFGAHTYELLSNLGEFVHNNWISRGGNVSSTSYNT
jgi:6-phosphogluconate dehydrogenase